MDFKEQISGARGILNWSRDELSKRSGISTPAIVSIEEGKSNPKSSTCHALISAFAAEGLEFTQHGIDRRQVSSYTLDSYMDVLKDIEATFPNGGEVLKHCVDDRRSNDETIRYVSKMRENGIKERLTISDNNDLITGNAEDYRQIPKEYFSISEVVLIYANKVAFFVEGKVLLVRSDYMSQVFKQQFEYWWKNGKVINEVQNGA